MEFHAPSPKPLTSKVVGVDVDCSPAALHYTGNELFWMHGVIGAREDLPCAQWRCCIPDYWADGDLAIAIGGNGNDYPRPR